MANERIRKNMKEKGVPFWQVAERLGVTEWTFGRWLRHEVSEELANKIDEIVATIHSERLDAQKETERYDG